MTELMGRLFVAVGAIAVIAAMMIFQAYVAWKEEKKCDLEIILKEEKKEEEKCE